MRLCYLVGCLLVAVSIITVNSLYVQIFFLKQVMKQVGQSSACQGKRDFEHVSPRTSLDGLVFPSRWV